MMSIVEGELNRELQEHPRNIIRTTISQSAGDADLVLPIDLVRPLEFTDADGNAMNQYGVGARAQALLDSNSRAYIDWGSVYELIPAPSSDTTYKLNYIAFLDPLATDLDTNWVSLYYSDLYLYGMLKEAAVFLKDDKRVPLWQDQFEKRLAAVGSQGWNQNIKPNPKVR
jgi:hypothetical protein